MNKIMAKKLSTYGICLTSNNNCAVDKIMDTAELLNVSLFIIGPDSGRSYWENKAMERGIPKVYLTYQILAGRNGKKATHPYLKREVYTVEKKSKKLVSKVRYGLTEEFWDIINRGCILVLNDCKTLGTSSTSSYIAVQYLTGLFIDLFNKYMEDPDDAYNVYIVMLHGNEFITRVKSKKGPESKEVISYMGIMTACRQEEFLNVRKKYIRELRSIIDTAEVFDYKRTKRLTARMMGKEKGETVSPDDFKNCKDRDLLLSISVKLYVKVIFRGLYV